MPNNCIAEFRNFVYALRKIWASECENEIRMKQAHPLMEKTLLADREFKRHSKSWPSTEGRKNLLFYTDPDFGFVINGVVRKPNRIGSAHDHGNCWVLYGLLDGKETLERFLMVEDQRENGYAKIELASINTECAGKADLVAPYDIHAEQGSEVRSVAVILRSKILVGKVLQGSYDKKNGVYQMRYGPVQIPFSLNAR